MRGITYLPILVQYWQMWMPDFMPMLSILAKCCFVIRNIFLIKQDFAVKIIHSIFRRILDYFEYRVCQFGLADFSVAIFILFSSVFMAFNINIHLVWFCFCFRCYWIDCRIIHPELYLCFVACFHQCYFH